MTQFLIRSSDPIQLEKATRIAEAFARQYVRDGIFGIVFIGAIVRGYFDRRADIDLAFYTAEGASIPSPAQYQKVEGKVHSRWGDYAVKDKPLFLRLLACVLLALVLAACDGSSPQPAAVEFHRTGGIAGFDDRLIVDANGQATLTRRTGKTTFALDGDTFKRLQTALNDSGFTALPENSMPSRPVPDGFLYEITYKGRLVRTGDPAVPGSLQPAVAILNSIISSSAK